MAYTALTVQRPTDAGAELTLSNGASGGAGTGYKFQNDGSVLLYITNTGTGTPNVVIACASYLGYTVTATTIALTATGGLKDIVHAGPFDKSLYNQDGLVYVYFTGGDETDVRIAAFK